ncbi:hypothetical protein [Indioceanicola profundi]|uniref:hypothetical protein n=1 Tax=Indioceanicola profundi TaxID=2220096 RepID=UPI000E6AC750|nr:hypothetical protein [Indioceanicola profundi]
MSEKPRADERSAEGGRTLPQADPALGPSTIPAGSPARPEGLVREAVGIFDSEESFQRAVDDLAMAGFGAHEMSLMSHDEATRERLGKTYLHSGEMATSPNTNRQNIVSPEELGDAQGVAIGIPAYVGAIVATGAVVASGGTALAAALAAAAAGAGGAGIGGVLAGWLGQQRHNMLQESLEKGGLLLWVNVQNPEREKLAVEILSRHSSQPVEVHEVPQI